MLRRGRKKTMTPSAGRDSFANGPSWAGWGVGGVKEEADLDL